MKTVNEGCGCVYWIPDIMKKRIGSIKNYGSLSLYTWLPPRSYSLPSKLYIIISYLQFREGVEFEYIAKSQSNLNGFYILIDSMCNEHLNFNFMLGFENSSKRQINLKSWDILLFLLLKKKGNRKRKLHGHSRVGFG